MENVKKKSCLPAVAAVAAFVAAVVVMVAVLAAMKQLLCCFVLVAQPISNSYENKINIFILLQNIK